MRTTCIGLLIAAMVGVAAHAAALTAAEVSMLRDKGFSDETIQLLIAQERERADHERSAIRVEKRDGSRVYATGAPVAPLTEQQRLDVDRAWRMLENMSLELRTGRGRSRD